MEIGILKDVQWRPGILVADSPLFLTIEHKDNEYIGTLVLHDAEFHRQIHALLLGHLGEPLTKIGSLDVSHISPIPGDERGSAASRPLELKKVAKQRIYKEHRIEAFTRRLPDSNRWTAYVVVTWNPQESKQFDIRRGFATEEDAIRAALEFGQKWIDDGKPKLR
jgi:hypothetical protein